ncbi:MAG: preprotein translocase subunit SecE [bacterium]|nr:preprotein translocase subunit SecE [bacterium]
MVEKIRPFFEEVKAEMFKVTWATKQEAIAGTALVVIVSVVLSVFIGFMDLGFSKLIQILLK